MKAEAPALSMFDGVTAHWWGASVHNADELARMAHAALTETGQPQGVHFHAKDAVCNRGDGCYAIRVSALGLTRKAEQ